MMSWDGWAIGTLVGVLVLLCAASFAIGNCVGRTPCAEVEVVAGKRIVGNAYIGYHAVDIPDLPES